MHLHSIVRSARPHRAPPGLFLSDLGTELLSG